MAMSNRLTYLPPYELSNTQLREIFAYALLDSPDQVTPNPIDTVLLESEKKIDYRKLRDLLKAGEWEEADRETYRLMITIVDKEGGQWLDLEDLKNLPCTDLLTIDELWLSASNGHFGFSVQKKIWEECGSPTGHTDRWNEFGDRVGWRQKGEWKLGYADLKKDLKLSPVGEFPLFRFVMGWMGNCPESIIQQTVWSSLFSRTGL
jgi:GUN4-like